MTYSHDGFGLGDLRRNTTIASRFVGQVPKSSVLMLMWANSIPDGLREPNSCWIKVFENARRA